MRKRGKHDRKKGTGKSRGKIESKRGTILVNK
jgi:hypothetical protein